jgi:hypothetical protein
MAKPLIVEHTREGKRIKFKAKFLGIPLMDDASAAQGKAGYHPAGYGGPMDLTAKPTGKEGEYEATWTCNAD